MNKHLLDWATSDDTGVSSKAIFRFMLGLEPNDWGFRPPADRGDRGRCVRLLKIENEFFARINEMRQISREWDKQIDLIIKEFKDAN